MIIFANIGTGKTTLAQKHPNIFKDMEYIPYAYKLPKSFTSSDLEKYKGNWNSFPLNNKFPKNYFSKINSLLKKGYVVILPPIPFILEKFKDEESILIDIENTIEMKNIILDRCIERGNTDKFINILQNLMRNKENYSDIYNGKIIKINTDIYLGEIEEVKQYI